MYLLCHIKITKTPTTMNHTANYITFLNTVTNNPVTLQNCIDFQRFAVLTVIAKGLNKELSYSDYHFAHKYLDSKEFDKLQATLKLSDSTMQDIDFVLSQNTY